MSRFGPGYTRTDEPNYSQTPYLFSFNDPIQSRVKGGLDIIHSLATSIHSEVGNALIPSNYVWEARDLVLFEELKDELIRHKQMDFVKRSLFYVAVVFFLKGKHREVSRAARRIIGADCDLSNARTMPDLVDAIYFAAFRPTQV
jgi:hypothetical protein